MVGRIVVSTVGVFFTTVLVVKLARVLFDMELVWLAIVVPVCYVVGAVVVGRRAQRRTQPQSMDQTVRPDAP